MVRRGCPFSGLLYAGLAITSSGPRGRRIQLSLRRSGNPGCARPAGVTLGQLLHATATGTLADVPPLQWHDGYAVTVVLAAENYRELPNGWVSSPEPTPTASYAGTAQRMTGAVVSSGGRVSVGGGEPDPIWMPPGRRHRIIVDRRRGGHFRTDIALAAAAQGR